MSTLDDLPDDERAIVDASLLVPSLPYNPMWRTNASLKIVELEDGSQGRVRHEPETLAALAQLEAIDATMKARMAEFEKIWAKLKATAYGPPQACKDHHWRNVDWVGRCGKCGQPLAETDPAD